MKNRNRHTIIEKTFPSPAGTQSLIGYDNVISLSDTTELQTLPARINQLENRYITKRNVSLKSLQEKIRAQEKSIHENLLSQFQSEFTYIKEISEAYFNDLESHCFTIIDQIAKKLMLDLPDDSKTLSAIKQVICTYKNEVSAILFVPEAFTHPIPEIPDNWEIKNDSSLFAGQCRLSLKFGYVEANFDSSLNHILKAIAAE